MVLDYANKLSEVVLKKGINLKKGQCLNIVVGPRSYEYASIMARKAYEMGAKYVQITVNDTRLDATRSVVQSKDEDLQFVPSYLKNADYEYIAENWARVRIDSGEDRIDEVDSDLDRLQIITKAKRQNGKEYSNKTMANELSWNVCAVPGPMWARKIMGADATEEDLANVMSKIMRLDREDYLEAWDEFDKINKKRANYLNSLGIKELHYRSPRTDFKVGFRREARFSGASNTLPDGTSFFPNLPTEEIFSVPDMDTASGYITTTKPVTVLDNETEEVKLYFEKGKVIDVEAKKGLDIMRKYLAIDEGSSKLGEVALVDVTSPIAMSNLVFGSILIDENASCHIAIGAGYPECLETEYPISSDEELLKLGCNVSLVHTDFMVGSDDLEIVATTYEGKSVTIMKDGRFTL